MTATLKDRSFRLAALGPPQLCIGLSGTLHAYATAVLPALFLARSTREQVYNVLWVLVFAFATLNILSLGVRRVDRRGGLSFGEVIAIMVVVVSIVLLSWEMLYVFHVLPIHISPE